VHFANTFVKGWDHALHPVSYKFSPSSIPTESQSAISKPVEGAPKAGPEARPGVRSWELEVGEELKQPGDGSWELEVGEDIQRHNPKRA
jgi:hypothetical protein